jgi:hypothetical protein
MKTNKSETLRTQIYYGIFMLLCFFVWAGFSIMSLTLTIFLVTLFKYLAGAMFYIFLVLFIYYSNKQF